MITLTFEPTNSEQAALLGKFLPEYMAAGALQVSGEPEVVKAVVERAAEVVDTEKPKKSKPAKPAAAAADSASATGTSETTSQPAPTPTATTAATDITLEQVRAKLAELSQAGKAAEVKGLIAQFGVAKLTEVPKGKYAELLAAAEGLA